MTEHDNDNFWKGFLLAMILGVGFWATAIACIYASLL